MISNKAKVILGLIHLTAYRFAAWDEVASGGCVCFLYADRPKRVCGGGNVIWKPSRDTWNVMHFSMVYPPTKNRVFDLKNSTDAEEFGTLLMDEIGLMLDGSNTVYLMREGRDGGNVILPFQLPVTGTFFLRSDVDCNFLLTMLSL